MIIYNFSSNKEIYTVEEINNKRDIYLIIANYSEKSELIEKFIFHGNNDNFIKHDRIMHYEVFEHFDFVRLLYMDLESDNFKHSNLNIYLGDNVMVIYTDNILKIKKMLKKEIMQCLKNQFDVSDKLSFLYYSVFHYILRDMFMKLEKFENLLLAKENDLMKKVTKEDFRILLGYKRTANELKRNMRLLAYISDEIVDNDANELTKKIVAMFKNIHYRAQKIYEFAVSIQETSNHLLAVYDSKIGEQTNSYVNALTTITIFITPVTFISSLYGMNFRGTPIIEFKLGVYLFLILGTLTVSSSWYYIKLKRTK